MITFLEKHLAIASAALMIGLFTTGGYVIQKASADFQPTATLTTTTQTTDDSSTTTVGEKHDGAQTSAHVDASTDSKEAKNDAGAPTPNAVSAPSTSAASTATVHNSARISAGEEDDDSGLTHSTERENGDD